MRVDTEVEDDGEPLGDTVLCPSCKGMGFYTEYLFVEPGASFEKIEYKGLGVYHCKMCKGRKLLPVIDMRGKIEK